MGRRRAAAFVALAVAIPVVVTTVVIRRSPADRPAAVVISEVMTSNASTLVDEDGETSDWIEVWNRSNAAIDLAGWHLSDGGDDDADDIWEFPGLVLGPGERAVIFASGKADRHRLHTNFRLSSDGEYLGLRDARGRTVDEYRTPPLGADMSYGLGSNEETGILLIPTPGQANSVTRPAAAARPVLSRAGGYIDGAVSIDATTDTEGAQLWFTVDGSTPTAGHGTQFVGPIAIDRTTTLRMVATRKGLSDSPVTSATYLVMDEVLAQQGTPLGWSTAAVNGQVYEYGFDQNFINEHRADVADALQAAPTLSIITDLDNLIGKATGIYSNPAEAGPAWERPASMELIDGDAGFQINGGIRLKGGYFRSEFNPAHSFRLTFAPQYEGVLNYPLFGSEGVQTFASVDLRTEQNYAWQSFDQATGSSYRNTMLRDQFVRDSQAAAGDPATRSRWVHLFLNGQYWGMYMLRDNITAEHATQLWGGSKNDYDVIESAIDYGYDVADGDDDEWLKIWDAISDGRLTHDEFTMVAHNADLVDLADFVLINICTGNLDSTPTWFLSELRANNWQAVRGNGQPFRFFLDDAEHTLGAKDHNIYVDRTQDFPILEDNEYWNAHHFNPGWLHQVLLTREEYRTIFRERVAVLLASDGPLGATASLARWQALRETVDPLIDAQAARWGYAGTNEFGRPEWEAEVDWVARVWIPRRNDIVLDQLRADGLLVD